MFTYYGDSYMDWVVSNEKENAEPESNEFDTSGLWMVALEDQVNRLYDSIQFQSQLQPMPEPLFQVACTDNAQFC